MRPVVLLGLAAAGTLLLAACGSDNNSTPSASAPTTHTSTSTGASGSNEAPKVAKPLNAASLSSAPCSSLTAAQLSGIGLTNVRGGDNSSITGTAICGWTDDTTGNGIGISWENDLGNGLSTIYSEKAQQGYWQPTSVDGYPAVFADFADLRSKGTCMLNVGVSDKLNFISQYTAAQPDIGTKSCQFAEQAAADVIKNLGGA
jgi:hypothetical protein